MGNVLIAWPCHLGEDRENRGLFFAVLISMQLEARHAAASRRLEDALGDPG